MSRRTKLAFAIQKVFDFVKGSHLTREARAATAERFAAVMMKLGYTHLKKPEEIKLRHLKEFVSYRKSGGVSTRTLQNSMAHLRSVLRNCGRADVADAPESTNRALGISGGTRIGTKIALTDEELFAVDMRSKKLGRPGMGCLLKLERHLGLRGNEAIHARSDTLIRWRGELEATGTIAVIAGTKGGRSRTVNIKDVANAMLAINEALLVAHTQRGFLIVRRNGDPAGGLKQAREIYHGWMNRAGVHPHVARYAFACMNFGAYCREGYPPREALILVSRDLGHGSGRGRWIRSVYMRNTAEERSIRSKTADSSE